MPIVCGALNPTGTASAWSTSVQPILDQGDLGRLSRWKGVYESIRIYARYACFFVEFQRIGSGELPRQELLRTPPTLVCVEKHIDNKKLYTVDMQ